MDRKSKASRHRLGRELRRLDITTRHDGVETGSTLQRDPAFVDFRLGIVAKKTKGNRGDAARRAALGADGREAALAVRLVVAEDNGLALRGGLVVVVLGAFVLFLGDGGAAGEARRARAVVRVGQAEVVLVGCRVGQVLGVARDRQGVDLVDHGPDVEALGSGGR